MALHQVIWHSLCYPLTVTSFSETQALLIVSKLYHTLLPHLGANHFYPLDLQHVPPKFQGLGLPHPFWEQGCAALKLFLEFSNTAWPEHMLIQTSLEYLQLEVGSGVKVLQVDFNHWGFLATECWLKSLWKFAHFAQICILLDKPFCPLPQ